MPWRAPSASPLMSRSKSPPTRCNRSRLRLHPGLPSRAVMRNATIHRIYEGTNRIQRVVIVARCCADCRRVRPRFGTGGRRPCAPAVAASSPDDGVPGAVRAAADPRWAAGGVGMRSALAGFVVWVRPLQNLCGDARRSSHGPPDRTRRSHAAGRRTIPDDSRGISCG